MGTKQILINRHPITSMCFASHYNLFAQQQRHQNLQTVLRKGAFYHHRRHRQPTIFFPRNKQSQILSIPRSCELALRRKCVIVFNHVRTGVIKDAIVADVFGTIQLSVDTRMFIAGFDLYGSSTLKRLGCVLAENNTRFSMVRYLLFMY